MPTSQRANRQFEDEVRRTAEAIWGLEPGACQPQWYEGSAALHELDGLARLPDLTHLLMVTTSKKLDKVKADVKKLGIAATKERGRGVPVQKWLITEQQLEAEHIAHARRYDVQTLTHVQFQRRFFNGRDYFNKRSRGAFGSARNLRDGSISIPPDEYVTLPMEARTVPIISKQEEPTGRPVDVTGIAHLIRDGSTVVLLGPFGAGKSLTTRELFIALGSDRGVEQTRTSLVPLAINCREHWGAIYGDEILDRHARSTGFTPRDSLTGAWRAGMVHLLLDGFDELAAQTISTPSDKHFMRQARHDALQGVRDLVGKAPQGIGVLLCGRDHYFDSLHELAHSLGINNRQFLTVRLGEFTEEQAAQFLRRRHKTSSLPDWLPRKPLILGYLAHQDLLDQVLDIDASRGFGYAWDSFLTLVCQREAEHERAVMDPVIIRQVLEGLACRVRASAMGTRPLTGIELSEVYQSQTGNVAGEAVIMQLQRLPGLTPREQDPTARSFVDADMLAALQGSAVARAVMENSGAIADRQWAIGLTRDGIRMAAHKLRASGFTAMTVLATAKRLARTTVTASVNQLVADCAAIVLELSDDNEDVDCQGLEVREAHLQAVDIEERAIRRLVIRNCIIETVHVGPAVLKSAMLFDGCVIGKVTGVPSKEGLPAELFKACDCERFDDASTNAAVLRLAIPDALKVLLTVLRKLYLQAGGGRKRSALKRGLPSGQIMRLVDRVVDLLASEGIVAVSNEVVHPVRKHTMRVHKIIGAGSLAEDPLVARVREL